MNPAAMGGGWAVVGYMSSLGDSVYPDDMTVMSSSSDAFANYAVDRLQITFNDEAKAYRTAMTNEPGARHSKEAPRTFDTRLYVEPAYDASVVVTKVDFPLKSFTADIDFVSGVYFRAVVDDYGAVVDLDVLYSKFPDYDEIFVAYIRDHLTVLNVNSPGMPVELYGHFGIGGPKLEPWYFTMAGIEVGR